MSSNNKGYITVEATLVVSAVLFIISGLILTSLFLYQQTLLNKTASAAAQQGAEIWTDSRRYIENGVWDTKQPEDPLYSRIFDDSLFGSFEYTTNIDGKQMDKPVNIKGASELQEKKTRQLRSLVVSYLGKGVLKPYSTTLTVNYANNLLQRELKVRLIQEIRIPFGGIKMLFDGKETICLKAEKKAVVAEPAEFIRNIDFMEEMAARSGVLNFNDIFDKIKNKVFKGGE